MASFSLLELSGGLFGGLAPCTRQHALKTAADDGFGIAHDARDQFGAARDVVDQALHLSGRPDALISVTGGIHHLAACAGDELADVLEFSAFLLHRDDLG